MWQFHEVKEMMSIADRPVLAGRTIDPARWDTVFMLLSLDSTAPFFEDLGLQVNDPDALKLKIRSLMQEEWDVANVCQPDEGLIPKEREITFRQFFEHIAQQLGEDTVQILYKWGTKVFQYDLHEDAQAFIWKSMLRVLADETVGYQKIRLNLPRQKVGIITGAIRDRLGSGRELQGRIKQVEQSPQSGWDEEIFHRYARGDGSPLDWVVNTIEYRRFRQVWEIISKSLEASEIELLHQWGKRQATAMNIPTELVGQPSITSETTNGDDVDR